MSDHALFLGKFLRHGTRIASLAPSSPWLARATVRPIDWAAARSVVELGAGTGPITRALVERAGPEVRVISVERDPDFVRLLRQRFAGVENLEIVEGDVEALDDLLSGRGLESVDAIVSGLPVPSFPRPLQQALFRSVGRWLAAGGLYTQITEIPWVYQGLYRRHFESVRFVFEPRNLPPAGAYLCRGVKDAD